MIHIQTIASFNEFFKLDLLFNAFNFFVEQDES